MHLSWQIPTATFHPLSSSTKSSNSICSVSTTFCCLSNRGEKVYSTNNRYGGGGVHVPRPKYIAISKSELLDAIVLMFDSRKEKDDFLLMSSCLDSILHAEHKSILEEMRADYDLTHSARHKTTSRDDGSSEGNSMPDGKDSVIDFSDLLGYSTKNTKINSVEISRVPVDTRFQHAFMQLLYNAQFEELSAADLMLTSALNTDYLLTLPVYVDWKKTSESKAIIFRRGYATERQKGLLIVEKLDYLQSKLLQALFFSISKPLGKVGMWFAEALESSIRGQDVEVWLKRIKHWFKEAPLFNKSFMLDKPLPDDMLGADQLSDKDLPIWLAAQRAVARYEGILSSAGPRGRLLRKLLTWTGLIPPVPEHIFNLDSDITASESYLRPIFLSRISLSDIWEPASRRLCGNNPWKMLKSAFSIFSSRSILQEPAFQELILLYTKEIEEKERIDQAPLLQLKIYERIPIPDLTVIFPHKKLSFRILDTVRLDIASILGILAYFINYKFENILSSPSAILLDVIAASALVIYLSRIILGYKQTWDRYQLLVNRTLYEKTLASGFGSVHFLLDASEQQQYKEAILAYAILLKAGSTQVTYADSAQDQCERFIYNAFKKKVEMPIDKAVNTLMRLDLVIEKEVGGRVGLLPIPCVEAYTVLKQRWNSFVS
ncbi:uncharacterized protein LOC112502465 isoform X1 [Cynara cardunculus var. scolymus]|uniref:uncharacterized protein LOC112502465 isoform X1 n=1 Tax=Cynara cardunculus var. scolymus TaxID=59895 RepID=UPI000D62FB5A|nr:uncharacterized protein LOC112502465 isoform X1 [Cynara cardunculus var. scolymus]